MMRNSLPPTTPKPLRIRTEKGLQRVASPRLSFSWKVKRRTQDYSELMVTESKMVSTDAMTPDVRG